jgi:hypothetical protein
MASSRTVRKRKRRRDSGQYDNGYYNQLPHKVMRSVEMHYLQRQHPLAFVLLMQLFSLYTGVNNGDLAPALVVGLWRSRTTFFRHLGILVQLGWLTMTRPGYWGIKNKPALYAVSWLPIDECGGKLELMNATTTPSDRWRKFNGMADIEIPACIVAGAETAERPRPPHPPPVEVHLLDQKNGGSSPANGPETDASSPAGGPQVSADGLVNFFSDDERRIINYCQRLPTRLKVPSWIKRERDRNGNTVALHFDWPVSTLAKLDAA